MRRDQSPPRATHGPPEFMKSTSHRIRSLRRSYLPVSILVIAALLACAEIGSFWIIAEVRANGPQRTYTATAYRGRIYFTRYDDFLAASSWNYAVAPCLPPDGTAPFDRPQTTFLGVRWSVRTPSFASFITISYVGIPIFYLAIGFLGVGMWLLGKRTKPPRADEQLQRLEPSSDSAYLDYESH